MTITSRSNLFSSLQHQSSVHCHAEKHNVSPGNYAAAIPRKAKSDVAQQTLAAHYTRLLRRWPVDRLRPEERTFQRLLQNRIQNPPKDSAAGERECNAAYLLLDNNITKRYPLGDKIMRPASDPLHYARIEREVDELPSRGLLGRMVKKLQGMVRMQ